MEQGREPVLVTAAELLLELGGWVMVTLAWESESPAGSWS